MATSAASRRRSLNSLGPTETLEIGGGLALSPRVKLLLTFFRSDPAVKPIDEWKLKVALLHFLRSNPLSLSIPDEDLLLYRRPDLHKRKRDEPVATGTLYVRDLGFLKVKNEQGREEDERARRNIFLDWRSSFVDRLAGIDFNLEGVKFKMSVEIPPADDFEQLKKLWEDCYASKFLDSRRGFTRRPDTIIVRGVPSRWLAEPRVSSKASMLVTHTIFSSLGKIRNLNVAGDNNLGNKTEETNEIISGLNCNVWVQFENYDDFYNAMKVLCGRSMQKHVYFEVAKFSIFGSLPRFGCCRHWEILGWPRVHGLTVGKKGKIGKDKWMERREGSRLKVDYEVSWDKDGFFRNVQQKTSRNHRHDVQTSIQGTTDIGSHRKRFRE